MSRRSGGGGGGGRSVYVSGYTRSNGTYVAPHYRSAPSSSGGSHSSSSSSVSSSSRSTGGGSVSVSGYYRSSGTYVEGYTRAAPSSSSASRSGSAAASRSGASSSGGGVVNVQGYYRSDGTYVAPHTRAAPSRSSSSTVSGASASNTVEVKGYTRSDGQTVEAYSRRAPTVDGKRVYCDNAMNRRLGRVGQTIPSLSSHASKSSKSKTGATKHLCGLEEPDALRRWMEELDAKRRVGYLIDIFAQFGLDEDQGADACEQSIYQLERASAEETWAKEGMAARTDLSKVQSSIELSEGTLIIPKEDVHLEKKIGQGGFGEVFAARWKGTPVAVKKLLMQTMSRRRVDTFKNEVEVLFRVSHPNIVRFLGAIVEPMNYAVVMEYMKRSLFTAIFIDEDLSAAVHHHVILQVATALEYLHSMDIAHCDVKSENVLLDEHLTAKLSDFGLSSIRNATETSVSIPKEGQSAGPGRGTPRYSAPEVLRGERLQTRDHMCCDVYSLSLVVYEVLVEEEVFFDFSLTQLIRQVGNGTERPDLPSSMDKSISDLIRKAWLQNASDRPTASQFKTAWSSCHVQ